MTIVIFITVTIIIVVVMITGRLVIEFILEGAFVKKARVGAQEVCCFSGIQTSRLCCSTQLLLPLQQFLLEIMLKRNVTQCALPITRGTG